MKILFLSLFSIPTLACGATLNISGTIPTTCILNSVVANSGASTINLISGETNKSVGTASVSCNNKSGFKMRATSLNNGKLVNSSSPNNNALYTFRITGAGGLGYVSLSTSQRDVYNSGELASPLNNSNLGIQVNVTATSQAWPGVYSDTITLTLSTL